jgi:hypothetical protein
VEGGFDTPLLEDVISMTLSFCAHSLRLCLCVAVLVLIPAIDAKSPFSWRQGCALAEPADASEKEAFEAAKSLGTVDAWEAFLKSYSSGFHADLARAYIKKLGEAAPAPAPAAAPPPAANDEFPTPAGSWGGIVRDGPGQDHRKLDSLEEGERISLMGRSDVVVDGYPWFKIWYRGERKGYMWGGILCSVGAERPDLYKTCPAASEADSGVKDESKACEKGGGEWDGRRCRPAGYFDEPKKKKPQTAKKKKSCPKGMYLNQLGACQPNETGG